MNDEQEYNAIHIPKIDNKIHKGRIVQIHKANNKYTSLLLKNNKQGGALWYYTADKVGQDVGEKVEWKYTGRILPDRDDLPKLPEIRFVATS